MKIASSLVLLLAAAPGLALAQSSDPAEALMAEGVELRRQGRDAEALERFRAAFDQSGSPRARAQVALAHQALGNWIEAESNLEAALDTRDPWVERNRGALEGALETVRSRLAFLEVRGEPAGAQVRVDGRDVGLLPLAEPARVVAGDVVVEVSKDGYATILRPVRVRPGATGRETIRLVPVSSGAPSEPSPAGARPSLEGAPRYVGPVQETSLIAEVGYSSLPRLTLLTPVGRRVSVGARAGIDVGLFNTLNGDYTGTVTFGGAVPFRIGLVDGRKVGVTLGLAPGAGFTLIDYTNVTGLQSVQLDLDVTGEYFAVLLEGALDFVIHVNPIASLGFGVEVPTALFFGGGTEFESLLRSLIELGQLPANTPVFEPESFQVVPILIGPTVQVRLGPKVTLGGKLRMGPHVLLGDLSEFVTGEDSRVDLALQAQLGLTFAL